MAHLDEKRRKEIQSPQEMESVEEENSRMINMTDSDDAEFASLEGDDKETLDDKKKQYMPQSLSKFANSVD